MDNKETPCQEGQEIRCTIDEFLAMMEPVFRQQKVIAEKCISGLTIHAANLAANQQEDSIPELGNYISAMALFWGLENEQEIDTRFEQAVTEARNSGQPPALTEQHKQDILAGLALYAQEMRDVDPDMEEWAVNCENFADSLQYQWQAENTEGMKMGGIT